MSETARLVIAAASEGLDAAIQKLEKLPGAAAKAAAATDSLASKSNAAAKQILTSEAQKEKASRATAIAMAEERVESAALALAQAKRAKTTTAAAVAAQRANNMAAKAAYEAARASHGVKAAETIAAAATYNSSKASLEAARALDARANAALRAAQADHASATAALQAANATEQLAGSARDAGLTTGQQTANMTNMAAQFQDIGVTAAMGMNPLMIALQQGTQMSMVFIDTISRGGGLVAGLRILGAGFLSLINPISLFIIGLVGALAVGIQMVDWTALWNNSLEWLIQNFETVTKWLVYFGVVAAVVFAPQIISGFISLVTILTGFLWGAVKAMVALALANPWATFVILVGGAIIAASELGLSIQGLEPYVMALGGVFFAIFGGPVIKSIAMATVSVQSFAATLLGPVWAALVATTRVVISFGLALLNTVIPAIARTVTAMAVGLVSAVVRTYVALTTNLIPTIISAALAFTTQFIPALVRGAFLMATTMVQAVVSMSIAMVTGLIPAIWAGVSAMVAFALANPFVLIAAGVGILVAAVVILLDAFGITFGDILDGAKKAGNFIIGVFVGSFEAVKATWTMLPAAMADLMIQAVNWVITKAEVMVNGVIKVINGFLADLPFGLGDSMTMSVKHFGRVKNPFAGSASKAASTGGAAFNSAMGRDYIGAIGWALSTGWGKVKGLLGGSAIAPEPGKGKAGKGKAGEAYSKPKEQITEAMKFGNMMKEGNLRIAQLERETKALGLLGVEAKKAAIISDMLNKAEQEGIKVDYRRKLMIEQKAQAIAQAEQFKEDRAFYWEQKRAYEDEAANLQQQTALIGLNGEAAARAAAAHKVWNYERQNNTKIGMVEQDKILNDAARVAQEQARHDAKKYHYDSVTQHNEQMRNLRAERDALGLNGEARAVVAEGQRILNWETEKGIKLNPFHRAQLLQNAAAFYRLNEETRLMAKNLEFVKDTSSDFFRDLFDDIREGENIWKAFGNTVLNVLNKIIDRLFDANLDTLFGQNSGSGGLFGSISKFLTGLTGGNNYASTLSGSSGLNTSGVLSAIGAAAFPSANGNVFQGGKAAMFATGGTFTNGVVSRPTAFDMGVMGEAGPEAIMPLRRGPDGSLGVQMHGGKASGVTEVKVEVTNIHQLTGAISSNDIVQLNRQSAEQTVDVVKQQVGDWLRQQQMDGTA